MQMTSCPFVAKTCSNTNSNIVLGMNKTEFLTLNYSSNANFNATAICYYTITANLTGMNTTQARQSQLWVNVWSYSNVYIHINNGTSRTLAYDPIQVDPEKTGTFFNYTAFNNTIYLIIVGNNAKPSLNISLSMYQPPFAIQSNVTVTDTPPVVIVINRTETINKTVSVFTATASPQYASLVLVGCVTGGSLIFILAECCSR